MEPGDQGRQRTDVELTMSLILDDDHDEVASRCVSLISATANTIISRARTMKAFCCALFLPKRSN